MLNAKNSSKFTKNSKILIGLAAILTVLYILSFTKSCTSTDKREKVKTALVNQKYKDSIESIILQDATGTLVLKNIGSFWTVARDTESIYGPIQLRGDIPASPEKINNFIEELIKVRNLYKISDKINSNSSLGLTNGTEFHIRYNYTNESSDSESFHELIFGNQDFSLSSRYLMTGSNTQVYEIDTSLDTYLTTSVQSWAEPYIISREIVSTDIQTITASSTDEAHKGINKITGKSEQADKLLELRHGGIPTSDQILDSSKSETLLGLDIENGDKSSIKIIINPLANQESTYLVETNYFDSEGELIYNSYSTISRWTYNKIKEITL